ncbi:NADH:flavin oxidoreductase [Rhodoplanes sp. Z2-YC6860]|uniref:NADH:flavin oxidoreductase n=1 Tax=Rhodoplanes sp. Z2-YC6860 TaxID=674703 RepID=UPI00078EC443|nr:NADH:flavin oxidoreductase [Rhodoplanes sp. Z2-YC6860]AMN40148.1 NADH:flavin oxidoreductase [Rhodoplanes sp. Z2-YC6860]
MNVLLTPARIGPITIPNRIVMPPMTTRGSDDEGHVTDQTIAYYMARVRGGTGLITVEMASPEKAGRHRRRELGIYDDRFVPGLTKLVQEIHGGGAKASIQLGHGGGHTRIDICGETPIAPSAIPHPVYETTFETIIPEEMTHERIARTTEAYVAAAQRAQSAGFDCVEIHAAHGYLISQFHTPFENRRTDEYGGSLENRARFGLDVLRAVRAAAPTVGIIFRVSVDDYFDGGMTYEDGRTIAIWASKLGADALHITAGHYRSKPTAHRMIPPMAEPDAPFLGYAADIKRQVQIPVIAVGRLGDPATATEAVASGKADFIALGRTLVADPQWVEKLRRNEPIRRCLACNTCIDGMRGGAGISCVVNSAAGRELAFADAKPPQGERIAVIGAGPAGLAYASLVASGNTVTVFEKDTQPGGAFRYAGLAPMFQDVEARPETLLRHVADMVAACQQKNVTFRFATDVRREPALLAPFDRIVVAAGAAYPLGLGAVVMKMLEAGIGRWPLISEIVSKPAVRDWFYYRARKATAERFRALAKPGQTVVVIGDAAKPGKSKEAIASAFEAALLGG